MALKDSQSARHAVISTVAVDSNLLQQSEQDWLLALDAEWESNHAVQRVFSPWLGLEV